MLRRLILSLLVTTVCAAQSATAVEPLSNGLTFDMTAADVTAKFGAPLSDFRSSGGGINYKDLSLVFNTRGTELWNVIIKGPSVRLASGITIGSTRADVTRVFGESSSADVGPLQLRFAYTGSAVREIRISISKSAAPSVRPSAAPARPDTPIMPPPAPLPSPTPSPARPSPAGCRLIETDKNAGPFPLSSAAENAELFRTGCVPAALVGSWMSQGTSRIDIHADGTFTSPSGGGGDVRVNGPHIIFTGTLKGWNNGRGFWSQGCIQFYWRSPATGISAFAFVPVNRH